MHTTPVSGPGTLNDPIKIDSDEEITIDEENVPVTEAQCEEPKADDEMECVPDTLPSGSSRSVSSSLSPLPSDYSDQDSDSDDESGSPDVPIPDCQYILGFTASLTFPYSHRSPSYSPRLD